MNVLKTEADRTRWLAFVQEQPLPLTVECAKWRATRSNAQNDLLFGVLYPPIAEAMGYPVHGDNGIHAFMCGTFWGWTDVKVPKTPRNPEGIASEPVRSTTRTGWHSGKRDVIDKATFARFLETVDRIAAQAGVFIPDMGLRHDLRPAQVLGLRWRAAVPVVRTLRGAGFALQHGSRSGRKVAMVGSRRLVRGLPSRHRQRVVTHERHAARGMANRLAAHIQRGDARWDSDNQRMRTLQ